MIYGEEAMEHLKSIGKIIYLKVAYETLEKRLGNLLQRGVAIRSGNTLLDLYNERVPLYEKYADLTINEQNRDIREVVEIIQKELKGQMNK